MKKINEILMHEVIMLDEVTRKVKSSHDMNYTIYHNQIIDAYEGIKQSIYAITDFSGKSDEDFLFYIANRDLIEKQVEQLLYLRDQPIYKKAMGEAALLNKKKLEDVLDYSINNLGEVFPINRQAVKIEEELKNEGDNLSSRLNELYQNGEINNRDFTNYSNQLFYIYQYYLSIARGEQIHLQEFSNQFYKKVDMVAKKRGIPFARQFEEKMQILRFQFEDVQSKQEEQFVKRKNETDSK